IDDFQKKRQRMAKIYDDALKELPLELPEWPTNASDIHAWHLYPIRLKTDSAINRDDFIKKLSDLGIGCSVHFIPLHKQPVWRDTYNLNASDFPVSEEC
ncbi:DegT/DnrJ/EryC1/StrS family aminotransferase, partial [Shigella sonnei]|nr:DegT/DnrJ/EryC1/StrS family aminotransferase [Shigella sonnei]